MGLSFAAVELRQRAKELQSSGTGSLYGGLERTVEDAVRRRYPIVALRPGIPLAPSASVMSSKRRMAGPPGRVDGIARGDVCGSRVSTTADGAGSVAVGYAVRRSEARTARASDQVSKVCRTSSSVWAMER